MNASLLTAGQSLRFEQVGPQLFISNLPEVPPDDLMNVVKLELVGSPDHDLSRHLGGADIFPILPA